MPDFMGSVLKHAPIIGFLLLAFVQCSLLLVYKAASNDAISTGSETPFIFSPPASLAVAECCKLLASVCICLQRNDLWTEGRFERFKFLICEHVTLRLILMYTVLGVAYASNNELTFTLSSMTDPGTMVLAKSLSPLLTAVGLWVLYARPLNPLQWITVMFITIGIVIAQVDSCKNVAIHTGLVYARLIIWLLISTITSLVNAHLVQTSTCPMSIQNILLYTVGMITNTWLHFSRVQEHSFFMGMDSLYAVIIIILNSFTGLVVSAVYKYSDAVVKTLASCFSVAIVVFASAYAFNSPLTINTVCGAIVVILATYVYMRIALPMQEAPHQRSDRGDLSNKATCECSCQHVLKIILLIGICNVCFGFIFFPKYENVLGVGAKSSNREYLGSISNMNEVIRNKSNSTIYINTGTKPVAEKKFKFPTNPIGSLINGSILSRQLNLMPDQPLASAPKVPNKQINSKSRVYGEAKNFSLPLVLIQRPNVQLVQVTACVFDFVQNMQIYTMNLCVDFFRFPYFWNGSDVSGLRHWKNKIQRNTRGNTHESIDNLIACHEDASKIVGENIMTQISKSAIDMSATHYRTCAIVGGAAQIHSFGREIDSADAVFRVNLHGLSKNSGWKTTYRVLDHVIFAKTVSDDQTFSRLLLGNNLTVVGSCIAQDKRVIPKTYPHKAVGGLFLKAGWPCNACIKAFTDRYEKSDNRTRSRVHVISPAVYEAYYTSMLTCESQTGSITMALAQSMCSKITVYGISGLHDMNKNGFTSYTSSNKQSWTQDPLLGHGSLIFAWQHLMGFVGKVVFRRQ